MQPDMNGMINKMWLVTESLLLILNYRLIEHVERLALKDGANEITIDTAEKSSLVEFYSRLGYRFVAYAQWKETNYRSVLMSKKL